ncbi:hypothetical protein RQP46_005091 [Phenoliferia psychrophenolica]
MYIPSTLVLILALSSAALATVAHHPHRLSTHAHHPHRHSTHPKIVTVTRTVTTEVHGCKTAVETKHRHTEPAKSKSKPKAKVTSKPKAVKSKTVVVQANARPTSGMASKALSAHNTVRSKHDAEDLEWSDELAAKAQLWANKCKFEHSGGSLGPYGENLAAYAGSVTTIDNGIQDWAAEVSDYNPNDPSYSHFTQLVWKSTTKVGCAVQQCEGIFDASYGPAAFYVCEYDPQGNIEGEDPENVQV